VTAATEPLAMIYAPGPGALLLLRFMRLIDCRCSALSRMNRSSSKVVELNELSRNPLPAAETGFDPIQTIT
jgi:hypothetical protein